MRGLISDRLFPAIPHSLVPGETEPTNPAVG